MASLENKKNRRTGWVNMMLVLLFGLGSLWLADLGFRAYERHYLLPDYPDTDSNEPVNLAQLSYNDGVVPRAGAVNEFRILSFGDSFTYSVMEPALSYNGIVEQKLNEILAGQSVRVVNLGEPGTGPNSFRLAHDYWSQIFEHQAVLFHIFLGNDVLDDAYLQSPLVWQPNVAVLQATHARLDAGSKRVPRKFPLRMLDYIYAAWLSHKTTTAADLPSGYNWAALTELDDEDFARTYFTFMDNFDPVKLPDLLPGYQQILLLLQQAQALSDQGIKVAVVLGPSEPMVNDTLRARVLAKAGADATHFELGLPARIIGELKQRVASDVPLLDLSQSFRERHQASGEKLYFRQNTHWDQLGNQLAGEEISRFLLDQWFAAPEQLPEQVPEQVPEQAPDHSPKQAQVALASAGWRGSELVSEAEMENYLEALFADQKKVLPEVTGIAREMQLFDGIIAGDNNWAMAELGQSIELNWESPLELSALNIHLYGGDGRSYGLLVEAMVDYRWQLLADRRTETVTRELRLDLNRQPIQAIRITGTFNSEQADNPANHYIHIEEIEWVESAPLR